MRANAAWSIRDPSSSVSTSSICLEDGDLAVALELQRVERLLPAIRAHDLVNVHGNKIMEDVKRAGPRPPGIVLAAAAALRPRWHS